MQDGTVKAFYGSESRIFTLQQAKDRLSVILKSREDFLSSDAHLRAIMDAEEIIGAFGDVLRAKE